MNIDICYDMGLIREIVTTPYIWERAAEDGIDPDDFYPTQDAMSVWLVCEKDNKPIGLILLHTDTSISVKMHIYLIKEYRKCGFDMMMAFYRWFLDNTHVLKITAFIPQIYKEVVKFAKKVGMKHEGLMRDSYKVHGELCGQVMLGITRKEIEEFI